MILRDLSDPPESNQSSLLDAETGPDALKFGALGKGPAPAVGEHQALLAQPLRRARVLAFLVVPDMQAPTFGF